MALKRVTHTSPSYGKKEIYFFFSEALTSRRAQRSFFLNNLLNCEEASGVILGGTASGADLGGSSKYSNENFED
jgi:hypothetical protein